MFESVNITITMYASESEDDIVQVPEKEFPKITHIWASLKGYFGN